MDGRTDGVGLERLGPRVDGGRGRAVSQQLAAAGLAWWWKTLVFGLCPRHDPFKSLPSRWSLSAPACHVVML